MNELLKKIYQDVISNENDVVEIGRTLDNEVNNLIEPYISHFNDEDIAIVKDMMYSILLKAEQSGFQTGVRYTMKMLLYLLSDL